MQRRTFLRALAGSLAAAPLARAPMMTPRHGLGAVAIDNTLYVAGGGPIVGGSIQSSIDEAFTLAERDRPVGNKPSGPVPGIRSPCWQEIMRIPVVA